MNAIVGNQTRQKLLQRLQTAQLIPNRVNEIKVLTNRQGQVIGWQINDGNWEGLPTLQASRYEQQLNG